MDKDRGLYMMHPAYTPGWVHLQSVKPYWSTDLVFDRSKKRIHYIPDDKPVTREFTLEREAPTDDGTFGTIKVGIKDTFKTLERPTCIPAGTYTVTLREPSAEFNYEHYHIQEAKNANGSELVLLHAGTSSDTGGIAIGKAHDLTFGHFLPLAGSTEAFDEFKKMVGEERFRLVVKGGAGKFKLSSESLKRLEGVHPSLVAIVKRAIEITATDFTVIEGVRTQETQDKYLANGATTVKFSKHQRQPTDNLGHAVDIWPVVNGKSINDWGVDGINYTQDWINVSQAMKQAAKELGIDIVWGGDWKSFVDGPHYELRN